ncbi:DNA adenine methylase [Halogeometricum sp. S1BR25-6]|uniref:site-specific DNA-methyltransferase (adenine-specific) n=1 Tax=Halogeometricum salsisoli TaxID=2950536 RepID=A0ABU2GJ91_9EURY|nr:DNA adenine methylase [Halogeometricum sp. S1BR25-6]MDS0300902.1 DNA adenine methylase [Halogeometricum sp. S1BR25-6]
MTESVFPFPGGKAYLAPWIIEHFPPHSCYVEVFGGSGAVLVTKESSHTEVYNDQDGDLVQFFKILREREEELVEWLDKVPYAREQHQEWKEDFYSGERPDDPIERAGRFFYLRYSQYASKYRTASGFAGAHQRNKARKLRNATEDLHKFAKRFRNVQIENLDFEEVITRYDSDDTLFYCDPPYMDEGDALYRHGEFEHERLVDVLEETDGNWLVSYQRLPERLQEYTVVEKGRSQFMNKQHDNNTRSTKVTERLAMNYDLNKTGKFQTGEQQTLDDSY